MNYETLMLKLYAIIDTLVNDQVALETIRQQLITEYLARDSYTPNTVDVAALLVLIAEQRIENNEGA